MSFANKVGIIWMDGKFIPAAEAKISVLTHSLHYGGAIFEGVRAYTTENGPAIFRLHDHTSRLFDSAHVLEMKIPYSKDELNNAQKELIIKNNLDSAYLRPLVFYGDNSLGIHATHLDVHVMIATWKWDTYLGKHALENGIKMRTSSYIRPHVNSSFSKVKCSSNYITSMLAIHEATDSGADEALLLDKEGFVAEGSAENIFIVQNGTLITPPCTSALRGLTRDSILTLANSLGIKTEIKYFTRDEIYIADEAFLTGTAAEVTPVSALDGRKVKDGKPGAITLTLQKKYLDCCHGKDKKFLNWLTFCQ